MQQAVSVLGRHQWVEDAWWDDDRNAILVRPSAAAIAARPTPGPLLTEHLTHWQHVYEYVYTTGADRHGDDLDLSGWRASDTGAPLPRDHMIEWIDHAVGLVLRNKPRVVLEVGCGSGLLVHRIHRETFAYIGLDVAAPVVARLRDQRLPGVHVLQASAHEINSEHVADVIRVAVRGAAFGSFAGPAPNSNAAGGQSDTASSPAPDCIVLNSVTQCFPDEQYLTVVLDDALNLVAPGGTVVVGDIRNLATASDFAHWLESTRDPGLSEAQLAGRITQRLAAEEELLCDPRLFGRIASRHARDVRVACYAKPMRADTELTRYRYDVVLTVDAPADQPCRSSTWAELPGATADRLRALRAQSTRAPTLIVDIPNALFDRAPDAVTPAALAAAIPADCAVLLGSADGRLLAVGPPGQHPGFEAVPDTELVNDPFARFIQRRLPEVLTDHLEDQLTATPTPDIVVAQEPNHP